MSNWKSFQCTGKDIVLTLVPAIGGRILSLSYQHQELLYCQESLDDEVFDFNDKDLIKEKERLGFRLWGGDKTWVAPQSAWVLGIPPLELDAAPYSINEVADGYVMQSPICRETGLQISRQVQLMQDAVHLTESIINKSEKAVSCGVWNVTQIKRPCQFEIDCSKEALRSYHHEDKTLPPVQDPVWKDGRVVIDCTHPQLFKYGGFPRRGSLLTLIPTRDGRLIKWQRIFDMNIHQPYAHRSAIEIFNSADQDYAEAEVHAPYVELKPGEQTSLSQCWTFTV